MLFFMTILFGEPFDACILFILAVEGDLVELQNLTSLTDSWAGSDNARTRLSN